MLTVINKVKSIPIKDNTNKHIVSTSIFELTSKSFATLIFGISE